MNRVAQKIMKRRGGKDPQTMLNEALDQFESWLGEGPFVTGDSPSVGDMAVHGCLTCVQDFPAFDRIMSDRPKIAAWFERGSELRA